MSIRIECSCGNTISADSLFAGGQVKCPSCGERVAVPESDPSANKKVHFNCPHCQTKVVGRRASVGKRSKCPACKKTYVIPEPVAERTLEPVQSPASFARQRIQINPSDVASYSEVLRVLERKT